MDLDFILEQKKEKCLEQNDLENVFFQTDIDLDMYNEIYQVISEEADRLKDDGKYKYKKASFKITLRKLISFFRNLDTKLKKNLFYRDHIRPFLVKIKYLFKKEESINLLKLLRKNGEEYVAELYRVVLGREPDSEGLRNNLNNLESGLVSKLQLFYFIYNCEENIRPKKLHWKRTAALLYRNK